MNSGIINILKPAGMTSNAVLSKIKKLLHPNKIGHLGTLDPSASGVLPICINKATKLFDYYLKKDKTYRTIFVFGKETDTIDSDGKTIKKDEKNIEKSEIFDVIPKLLGKQSQIPPNYSAKKIDGKRAYDLARNGSEFELKPKEVEIFSIDIIEQIAKNTFLFQIKCSSGTYVRSIARDMAKLLNTVAYVGAIIRTQSGSFEIENSILIDTVSTDSIMPLKNILKDRQNVFVLDELYDKITNGCEICTEIKNLDCCVVYCKGELIGLGNIEDSKLKITTNLREKND